MKTSDLLNALKAVKPAVGKNAIQEQTDHFIFDDDFVRTYNDKIAISYPLDCGFSCAVKAGEFLDLISKIKSEEIEMEVTDKGILITADGDEALASIQKEIKCPVITVEINRWKVLKKDFMEAAYFCSFSASKSASAKILTYLWLNKDMVVSTDRLRATKYELKAKKGSIPQILFSAAAAKELRKYEPKKFVVDGAWVHFKNDMGAIFSSRIYEPPAKKGYPEQVLKVFVQEGDKIQLPKDLISKIDFARIYSDAEDKGKDVSVQIVKGKMKIVGKGTLGWATTTNKIDYKKKKKIEFEISPEHFQEIIRHTQEMWVGADRLYFAGENFEHIITLK